MYLTSIAAASTSGAEKRQQEQIFQESVYKGQRTTALGFFVCLVYK